MKILYVSQSEIPSKSANSIHVMKMCSSLSKIQNAEIDLFCLKSFQNKNNIKDVYKFYLVKKNFNILSLKVFDFWLIREVQTLLYIIYCLLKKNYDLIYSRSIQISWFLGIFGIKTVLELHSPPSKKTVYFLKNILSKSRVKKLIVINTALKDYFLRNFDLSEKLKIQINPDASDKLFILKKRLHKLNIKKNSVGYLGHLYQGRGIDLIIKLAENLPKNNFYIVGGTKAHVNSWKKQVKSKNIFFLGFKNQLYCNHLRKKFDYLIAPYQRKVYVHGSINQETKKNKTLETSKWMSPLKLFEYMSTKKPIISSDLKAINEILTNNHDAILCNPDNFYEWKQAIEKLNKDKNLVKKISSNAFKNFLDNFTWDKRARKIIQEYTNLEITIFNFSLSGGGTEYMLSVLYNKLTEIKKYTINLLICQRRGHYVNKIENKKRLIFLNKERVIFSIYELYKFIKKTRTKILITSMLHTNIVAIMLKMFLIPSLKVIIRESNTISLKFSYDRSFKSQSLNFIAKKIYNNADAIIAPTNIIKNDLIKNYNVNSNLIHKIPNPYDFNEIEKLSKKIPTKKEKKLLQNDYLLSIGRLHPQKNFPFLIETFKYIVSNKGFENLKLFILGDGKDKNKLEKQINTLNLRKKVKLLGFQENPFAFMKQCKLFILSSIYEGHSNVLVHSQYLNNKILSSSAAGANKEVLSSNGISYNSKDPIKVANLAIKMLKSKKKNISKSKLLNKFSDKNITYKIAKLF
jgi:glycosyltransferase involved in cell wall biosynthesis